MIWALVVLLALISMLVVYSATGSLAYKNYKGNTEIYLFKQVAFIVLGIGIIYFAHRVNYIIYSKIAQLLFILSIPLLIYTLFFGLSMNEGSRWIRLPIIGMNMQTSELAKLALFMYLARLISKKQEVIKDFQKGIFAIDHSCWYYLHTYCAGKFINSVITGCKLYVIVIYWQSKNKTFVTYCGSCAYPFYFLVIAAVH